MAEEELLVKIIGDASNLKGEFDKAGGHVTSFSDKIGGIGKVATVAGGLVTAALGAIVTKTAAVGDQFDKMSLRTGIAVEDLSALAYAADISGTDIETLEKGLKGLTTVMDDASKGVGLGMDAFKLLDISVTDTEGKLRSTVDVLKEAATKISAIEDPTKQAALAMDLFGARAGPALLPLLKEGEGGIDDLMNKAKELGITMSTEAATKAAEFTDRMTDLKGSLAGAGRTIGDTLIPAIIPLVEKVTEIVGKVVAWTKENPELVATITKVVAIVGIAAAVGGPILMLVAAFSAVAPAIALIGTIATGPIGLLIIAVAAIVAIWKNWDKIVEFVKGFVEDIKNFLINLKKIAIQKVTEMIDWIIEKFKDLANLPKKMLEWGKNAITGFTDGIKSKMGSVTDAVKGVGDKIKGFLGFESPPKEGPLGDSDLWMPKMMTMFGAGITENLDLVIKPVKDLATGITNIFDTLSTDLKNTVKDIVGYLENNLSNAIYNLLSGKDEIEWSWKSFWEGLKDILIKAVAAMIAKLIVLAAFSWLLKLLGVPASWLGWDKGGGVGYDAGGGVKGYAFGGGTDTVNARLTPGEYVISKPMTDFIRRFQAIPGNLIAAVVGGFPTPIPAFAGGGLVGGAGGNVSAFGTTSIYVDIHDNKIADDVDIRRLAKTVGAEILKKIQQNRRY